MKKIFIMASERSGTNLLRKILGSHSLLSDPLPLHAWMHLSNLLPYYGPLENAANFDKLVSDALYLANIPDAILSWHKNLTRENLTPFFKKENLSSTVAALYSAYAKTEQKEGWVCKEANLFDYAYDILATFPDAKFIYLVRDGRDVATSVKKMLSHSRVLYYIVKKWRSEQLKCLSIYNNIKSNNSIVKVRYEDLLVNPVDQLTKICSTLEIPFESGMLQFYESESSIRESTIHNLDNISKPLDQTNFNKYQKLLSLEEIKLFEHIGGDVLSLLGYDLEYPKRRKSISTLKKVQYHFQNSWYRRQDQVTWKKKKGVTERKAALSKLYQQRESDV